MKDQQLQQLDKQLIEHIVHHLHYLYLMMGVVVMDVLVLVRVVGFAL